MSDINKIDQHGEHSIGIVMDDAVGIFSPTYILNNALNKLPFEFKEDGQLFYSLQYPHIRYGFKKSILYYYTVFLFLMVITSIFSINPPKDLFFLFVFTLPLASYFVYHNLKQSNRLFANRIELNTKNSIIDFKNIRKLKKDQLNVKIYFKQELYPKYALGLRNEDQVDLIMESYENWLENQPTELKDTHIGAYTKKELGFMCES
jgi:hypothetical protein